MQTAPPPAGCEWSKPSRRAACRRCCAAPPAALRPPRCAAVCWIVLRALGPGFGARLRRQEASDASARPENLLLACTQLRGTLEDLHAESLRILAGRPTLPGLELPSPPSDLSCDADGTCGGKEPPAAAAAADPASVLDLARVSGSSTASSAAGSSGRPSGAAMAASSAAAPASFPLPLAALQAASSSCLDASLQPQPVWRQLLDTRQLASLGAAAGLLLALHCLLLALLVA